MGKSTTQPPQPCPVQTQKRFLDCNGRELNPGDFVVIIRRTAAGPARTLAKILNLYAGGTVQISIAKTNEECSCVPSLLEYCGDNKSPVSTIDKGYTTESAPWKGADNLPFDSDYDCHSTWGRR